MAASQPIQDQAADAEKQTKRDELKHINARVRKVSLTARGISRASAARARRSIA